ncbi:MAG: YggS family pyridoxal phosphate-dependent enzyme [candidate division WOR-3 bacterium]
MSIAENLRLVKERIKTACEKVNRNPDEIKLVAVSKNKPVEMIVAAIQAGITCFGENRVQEAQAKIPQINASVEWHLVGNLQTNKVKKALELFHIIESVDSLHLALEIQRRCEQQNKNIPILIEVNTSGEPTKHGVQPEGLFDLIEEVLKLPRLQLQGLMTIGPGLAVEEPEASRACFQLLARLRSEAQDRFGIALPHLSMGMSSDFIIGIEEGATIIRIGTALFGPR